MTLVADRCAAGDRVALCVDVCSDSSPGHVHRIGTCATVLEPAGPDAWLVDVRVPTDAMARDAWCETLKVYGPEIAVVSTRPLARARSGV